MTIGMVLNLMIHWNMMVGEAVMRNCRRYLSTVGQTVPAQRESYDSDSSAERASVDFEKVRNCDSVNQNQNRFYCHQNSRVLCSIQRN